MDLEPLKIKTQANFNWGDIVYINDFDADSLKIIKRESKIGVNIYYIEYSTIRPLYFVINRLSGYIKEIEGSSYKCLVVLSSFCNKNIASVLDKIWGSIEDQINPNIKIKDYDKFKFNSDTDLPLNTTTEFRSLVINVSCVIEKDNEYYPEIYLDECLYVKDNTWYIKPLFPGDVNIFPTKKNLFSLKYDIK